MLLKTQNNNKKKPKPKYICYSRNNISSISLRPTITQISTKETEEIIFYLSKEYLMSIILSSAIENKKE